MQIKTRKLRSREEYTESASKLHRKIGEILSKGVFEGMVVFQEYPVDKINPACTNSRLKVDWYIKTLNIAIEVQGQHHFKAVQYGGIEEDQAAENFVKQVHKDQSKTFFCEQAGCPVIEVNHKDKPDEDWLLERIKHASQQEQVASVTNQAKIKEKAPKDERKEAIAEKRRAYSREQYRRARDRRRGSGDKD